MKKLSKVLSVICALVLVASLGVTAFADSGVGGPEPGNAVLGSGENEVLDVELLASNIAEKPATYVVNINWESLAFEYEAGKNEWNSSDHSWQNTTAKWTGGGVEGDSNISTIEVINNSSVGVTVTGEYKVVTVGQYVDGTPYKGVTVDYNTFSKSALQAGDANNIGGNDTNKVTATVTVSGTPEEPITSSTLVGTVTITISPASEDA